MKQILVLIILFSAQSYANDRRQTQVLLDNVGELVENNRYEQAAQLLADDKNDHISTGYRALSVYIRIYSKEKNKYQLAEKYAAKGCNAGDHHSCREQARLLVRINKYSEAESIFIKIANAYSDPVSAGELVSLYHNRNWDGFNEEKAKYWQHKVPEFAKKQSNK